MTKTKSKLSSYSKDKLLEEIKIKEEEIKAIDAKKIEIKAKRDLLTKEILSKRNEYNKELLILTYKRVNAGKCIKNRLNQLEAK